MSILPNISKLVRPDGGVQDRRIYYDQDVYDMELERIFARSWLFLAQDSLIPEKGDFLTTFMGQDRVIVTRGEDGQVKAFLNACSHRGNIICRADSGNAKSFVCNYHGWAFGSDGRVSDIPLQDEIYPKSFDRSSVDLKQVRVESYRGFIFGTFDDSAPSLIDYLGEMAWYFDTFMDVPGGSELLGPPTKVRIKANWKFFAENFVGDFYHAGWTHAAAIKVIGGPLMGILGNQATPQGAVQFATKYGHGFNAAPGNDEVFPHIHQGHIAEMWEDWVRQRTPVLKEPLGDERAMLYNAIWDGSMFPNTSFLRGIDTWKVWQPRGPRELEVWTWTLVERDMPEELKRGIRHTNEKTFGVAGILEGDDGENMEGNTNSSEGWVTRNQPLNAEMGLGAERLDSEMFPSMMSEPGDNEAAQRNFLRMWETMMSCDTWEEIMARRTREHEK